MKNIKAGETKSIGSRPLLTDTVQIEQYKSRNDATAELFHLLESIWNFETMPDDFVYADTMLAIIQKEIKERSQKLP